MTPDKIVEEVLPVAFNNEMMREVRMADRESLKQAIEQGKLVVPLSEEEIQKLLYSMSWESGEEFIDYLNRVSKVICQAQFKKDL